MPKTAPPRTLEHFLADLERRNKTIAEWARERKFDLPAVYAVTRGHNLGRYGQSRHIVVAMGLTPPPMFGTRSAD